MKLTKEEKADRYDSLQTAIKLTIEQYKKKKTALEHIAENGQTPFTALVNAGRMIAITKAIEDMEKWV